MGICDSGFECEWWGVGDQVVSVMHPPCLEVGSLEEQVNSLLGEGVFALLNM